MKNLLKLSFGGIPQRRCISMSVVLMEPLEMKMVDCPEIASTRSPRLNQVCFLAFGEKKLTKIEATQSQNHYISV